MKITSVHLAGFGRWANKVFNLGEGFNLIYGANEAGKSTLLHFIVSMFYGLGDLRAKDLSARPRERFQPWSGGTYGGSLSFELKGRSYKLERHFGKQKNQDRCVLRDATTAEELPLAAGVEPGESLLKMSQSEFKNSVFSGQDSLVVEDENQMKKRLSATMTGSEAQVSVDEMWKALDELEKELSSDRRQQALLTRLRTDEDALKFELENAQSTDASIRLINDEIDNKKARIHSLQKEKEANQRQEIQGQKAKENQRLREGIALSEQVNHLNHKIEQERETLMGGELGLREEDLATAKGLLKSWQNLENAMQHTGNIRREQEEKCLKLETGGKLKIKASNLQALLEKQAELNKGKDALEKLKHEDELRFANQKHALEQDLSTQRLHLIERQKFQQAELAKRQQEQDKAERLRESQASLTKNREKYAASEARLKQAQDLHAQAIKSKAELEEEQKQLQAANLCLSRWEEAWDKSEKQDSFLKVLLAVLVLFVLAGLIGLLFKASLWPWILFGTALVGLVFFIVSRGKIKQAQKGLDHDRESMRSNGEKLLRLSATLEQQTQQVNWAAGQETQLKMDIQSLLEEREALQESIVKARETSSVLSENTEEMEALISRFQEEETKALEAVQALEIKGAALVYKPADAIAIEASKLSNQSNSFKQQLQLEAVTEETLAAELNQAKEALSLVASLKSQIEDLEKMQQGYEAKREQLRTELKDTSRGRIRIENFRIAEEDWHELEAAFERLGFDEQKLEQQNELMKSKLGSLGPVQAVIKLNENTNWLKKEGLAEERLSDEQVRDLSLERLAQEEQLNHLQEQVWRGQEQLKVLQAQNRVPAQIAYELDLNRHAIDEVLEEVACIDLAKKWIKEAEQEQRRSFGPAINEAFSKKLSLLSGEPEAKLLLSNQFDIHVEDAETGLAHESGYFSAGKIDQLYLALRLAIVESIYHGELKLPLIFDDSFVQFDSDRMRNAFSFLLGLARDEGVQIIFTTCHDNVLHYLESIEGVKVLCL